MGCEDKFKGLRPLDDIIDPLSADRPGKNSSSGRAPHAVWRMGVGGEGCRDISSETRESFAEETWVAKK